MVPWIANSVIFTYFHSDYSVSKEHRDLPIKWQLVSHCKIVKLRYFTLSEIKCRSTALQAQYAIWTNPELMLSVQGRTNPEPILPICSAIVQLWFLLIPSATSIQHFFLRVYWFVRPPFSYGSRMYLCIRSHSGSAEPILNKKCLQGVFVILSV